MLKHSEVKESVKDAFVQFSRNGVWGTCGACPRDNDGKAYPENCENFQRYDHQMSLKQLEETYKNYRK